MSKVTESLEILKDFKNEKNGKGYCYVKDKVNWNWDILTGLILMVILFPFWIRDVEYVRVKK